VNLAAALDSARRDRLYPAVILHGATAAARQAAALDLARTLLCAADPAARPCGACRHCRRIAWPGEESGRDAAPFHPDFQVLERDLKTATSVEATRALMQGAQLSPFEARGQVFVVASAESLGGEAANALLKTLEEPHLTAPRHFLLLAPSRLDLLPTLRSRSLAIFLGPAEPVDPAAVETVSRAFAAALAAYAGSGAPIYLLSAAEALAAAGGWEDPRSGRPWALAAAAVLAALRLPEVAAPAASAKARRALLALAEDLLGAPAMRLRAVTAERILEGLVSRHLAALGRA
jgi:DNA polymerase III delta subunit-like protein